MRKKIALLLPLCLLLAAVWVFAAGDAADPLASLSYLQGTFMNKVDAAVDARLNGAVFQGNSTTTTAPSAFGPSWAETQLKQGDLLLGSAGDCVLILAGDCRLDCPFGTVVDATTGTEAPNGATLTPRHRYIVAEDTTAGFTVTGKTAVVDYEGSCTLNYSNATDYYALASALKSLRLFQGSGVGYGGGLSLENRPTRLQAIIMFVRLLGEEEEALSWSGTTPFEDIKPGSLAAQYVGYAYEKGYTNGYTSSQFQPYLKITAQQYTEFLLRALGYSSANVGTVAGALDRAQASGVLTPGEAAVLRSGTFLRADLVYISYYALEAPLAGGGPTLAETLISKGIFTRWEQDAAAGMVTSWRL